MGTLNVDLSHAGRYRLPGWGPQDNYDQWFKTLGDMDQNHPQSRRCIYFLSSFRS